MFYGSYVPCATAKDKPAEDRERYWNKEEWRTIQDG
jgi:hypothetical protein